MGKGETFRIAYCVLRKNGLRINIHAEEILQVTENSGPASNISTLPFTQYAIRVRRSCVGQPICHVEINVSDLGGAQKFYGELFGWTFNAWEGQPYALFETGTPPGGGLSAFGGPQGAGGITVYVLVDDIESYLAKAQELGGSVQSGKHLIDPSIGYSATIADPEGNPIGLFQPPG